VREREKKGVRASESEKDYNTVEDEIKLTLAVILAVISPLNLTQPLTLTLNLTPRLTLTLT
jgi:hypothetical protein